MHTFWLEELSLGSVGVLETSPNDLLNESFDETKENEKPVPCDQCEFVATDTVNLKRHRKVSFYSLLITTHYY